MAIRITGITHVAALIAALPAAALAEYFVPTDVQVGDDYHLAFVTEGRRDATESDLLLYDVFVLFEAFKADKLTGTNMGDKSVAWKVIGSTASEDARTHAKVEAPVYRMDGVKIADGFDDIWDGTLDDELSVFQSGKKISFIDELRVFTGTRPDGFKDTGRTLGEPGGARVGLSVASTPDYWIAGSDEDDMPVTLPPTDMLHFYALSAPLKAPLFAQNLNLEIDPASVFISGSLGASGPQLDPTATGELVIDPDTVMLDSINPLPDGAESGNFSAPATGGEAGWVNGLTLDVVLDGQPIRLETSREPGSVVSIGAVNQTNELTPDTLTITNQIQPTANLINGQITLVITDTEGGTSEFNIEGANGSHDGDHTNGTSVLREADAVTDALMIQLVAGSVPLSAQPAIPSEPLPLVQVDVVFTANIGGKFGNVSFTGSLVPRAGILLGDMDGNGTLDAFDVDDFELALADKLAYMDMYPDLDPDVLGDLDGSGGLDAFDVPDFELALAGTGAVLPEPGTALLLILTGVAAALRRAGTGMGGNSRN